MLFSYNLNSLFTYNKFIIYPISIADVVVPSPAYLFVPSTLFLTKVAIASYNLFSYFNSNNTN